MTSAAAYTRELCAACGYSTLHTVHGCIHCKPPPKRTTRPQERCPRGKPKRIRPQGAYVRGPYTTRVRP